MLRFIASAVARTQLFFAELVERAKRYFEETDFSNGYTWAATELEAGVAPETLALQIADDNRPAFDRGAAAALGDWQAALGDWQALSPAIADTAPFPAGGYAPPSRQQP